MTLRHLDLFSGIGGFALGLQRAGGVVPDVVAVIGRAILSVEAEQRV